MSIGPLRGADDACEAVERTLTLWLPSVLAEVAALPGPDGTPRYPQDLQVPQAQTLPDPDALRQGLVELPLLAVSSPGTVGQTARDGSGVHSGVWRVAVSFFTYGSDHRDTVKRCRAYALAGRTVLLQHRTLGGASGQGARNWSEDFDPRIRAEDGSSLGGAYVFLDVPLGAVLDERAGHRTPGGPPGPTVQTTHAAVTAQEGP